VKFTQIPGFAPASRSSLFGARPIAASFHTSIARFQKTEVAEADDGGVNLELSAKLGQEISLEKSDEGPGQYSTSIKEYLENSPFEIHDIPGQEEVYLTRKFGDEEIKVAFTIADYGSSDGQDEALLDEEESASMLEGDEAKSEGAQEGEQEMDERHNAEERIPVRLIVTIAKPNKGAIVIECLTQDGESVIEGMSHYPSKEIAEAKTSELQQKKDALYDGPEFGTLDEDLQQIIERYLDARGINVSMALFVPDYIDYKEQKEYVRWLENVRDFVEE
jgi:complement component 1 Q subcomponent-binding protein